jgi:hypothetical protein
MLSSVSSPLANNVLARVLVGSHSEPFLLATIGAALILAGNFVRWRERRNRTKSLPSSSRRENTNSATVPNGGVEANSSVS